jgi:alkyldihydroxyacetonephosphate synthase
MHPRLKHFGWGREGEGLTPAEEAFVLGRVEQRFGPAERIVKPPRLEDIKLAPPRLDPPPSLPFCSTVLYDRVAHTYGKSFPDYVRGLVGDYSNAPDVVAYPRTEEEVAAVLDWAGRRPGERDTVRRRSRATPRCGAVQGSADDRFA